MSQLSYSQNMTEDQLYRIYRQKMELSNLRQSPFCLQSYIQYPYYFQNKQRIQSIIKKQKKLFLLYRDRVLCQIKRKFILIRKVMEFDNQDQLKVKQNYIVDRKSLQVIQNTQSLLTQQYCNKILVNYSKDSDILNKKPSKHLFLGRLNHLQNSITFNSHRISKKHLIIQKLQTSNKQNKLKILNLLWCLKKSRQYKKYSKLLRLYSSISHQLIKIIIKYIGIEQNKHSFIMYDFASKNGTKILHKNKKHIILWETQQFITQENDNVTINIEKIIKSTQTDNLTEQISKKIRDLHIQNYMQIYNRNQQRQKMITLQKNEVCVMMLSVQTPKLKQLYMLYKNDTVYRLIKQKDRIIITQNREEMQNQQLIGDIQYFQTWKISNFGSISLFQIMKSKKYYQMGAQNYICMGNDQKVIIYIG